MNPKTLGVLFVLAASSCLSNRGFTFVPLEPIGDDSVHVVPDSGTPEALFEDAEISILVAVPQAQGNENWFIVTIRNKSHRTMQFRESTLQFEGSDDCLTWKSLALIPARESEDHWRRVAAQAGSPMALEFLKDTEVQPDQTYMGIVEFGQRSNDREFALYRLHVRTAEREARFMFENTGVPTSGSRTNP
jgi:hypothetical protein